jgi:hypothetical protein
MVKTIYIKKFITFVDKNIQNNDFQERPRSDRRY